MDNAVVYCTTCCSTEYQYFGRHKMKTVHRIIVCKDRYIVVSSDGSGTNPEWKYTVRLYDSIPLEMTEHSDLTLYLPSKEILDIDEHINLLKVYYLLYNDQQRYDGEDDGTYMSERYEYMTRRFKHYIENPSEIDIDVEILEDWVWV